MSLGAAWGAQAERAEPGVEAAVAVAVVVIGPIGAALVPGGADQTFDIGFHQELQHSLRYGSQKIAIGRSSAAARPAPFSPRSSGPRWAWVRVATSP
jgi:hypothetical protein